MAQALLRWPWTQERRLDGVVAEQPTENKASAPLFHCVCFSNASVLVLTSSVSSLPQMFWSHSRTGTAVVEKVKISSGSRKWQSSVRLLAAGAGVSGGLSVSSSCLPLAHELPLSPLSFVHVLPRLPWNVFLVYFFPHSHSSCGWRYFHSLTVPDTPFLWKQTRALMTWLEKARAARCQLTGRAGLPRGAVVPALTQGKNPPGARSKHLAKQNSVSGSRRWRWVGKKKILSAFCKRRV